MKIITKNRKRINSIFIHLFYSLVGSARSQGSPGQGQELAHAVFYWNSEIDRIDVQNPTDKVTILAKMSNSGELVDIVYSTPRKNAKLLDIPVPYPFTAITADRKPMNFLGGFLREDLHKMCVASGQQVTTLDGAQLRAPWSQCYHLLAKDCSSQKAWTVLTATAGPTNIHAKVRNSLLKINIK